MSDELKPCPFCGGPATVFPVYDEYDSVIGYAGWCAACGGAGGSCNKEADSARQWNTRPVEDALRAERDAALAEVARLRQANEYLEGANVALRGEHQQLCADWVKVLGNPANPEELDKAIAETPGMHALVRAIPWEAIEIAQQMYTLALEDMSGKVTLEDAAGYLVIVAAAKALDAFVGAHAPQPQEPQP